MVSARSAASAGAGREGEGAWAESSNSRPAHNEEGSVPLGGGDGGIWGTPDQQPPADPFVPPAPSSPWEELPGAHPVCRACLGALQIQAADLCSVAFSLSPPAPRERPPTHDPFPDNADHPDPDIFREKVPIRFQAPSTALLAPQSAAEVAPSSGRWLYLSRARATLLIPSCCPLGHTGSCLPSPPARRTATLRRHIPPH